MKMKTKTNSKAKARLKPLMFAILAVGGMQPAIAQVNVVGNYTIQANNDENNGTGGFNGEGVFISSNNGSTTGGAAYGQFRTGGGAQIWGAHQALLQSTGSYFSAMGSSAEVRGDSVELYSNSTNIWIDNADTGPGVFQLVDRNGQNSSFVIPISSDAQTTQLTAYDQFGTSLSSVTVGSAGVVASGVDNFLTASGSNTITGAANVINGATSINANNNAATNINTGNSNSSVTIGNAANTTTIQSGTNVITGAVNSITSTVSNTVSGPTNNITATAANNITGPTNNITGTTNINTGANNFATNINTDTNTQAVSIGNTGLAGTNLVTARSGNTTMSLANNVASLTAGAALGSNGISGTTSATGAGGLTVYNTVRTIGASVGGVVTGKLYQNQINGNLFVDGNVYINGTLDYVSSNAANTTVIGDGPASSNLVGATGGTRGGVAVVMKGSDVATTQTRVDPNGKLTNVALPASAAATESTASLTLTNGLGNTHGLVVTESQTTMSGGTASTSLTLNDNGATFSNAATGRPVRVHGVYDGRDDFDAVNVRQLGAGVAMASALAAMPQVDANKRFNLTAGAGNYLNASALALGGSLRVRPSTLVRFGAAFSTNRQRMVNVGFGHSF